VAIHKETKFTNPPPEHPYSLSQKRDHFVATKDST
jgi:hypothetical protein